MTNVQILVADDAATSRAVLLLMLAKRGYQAAAVANGQEAWDMLHRDRRLRVVLLDWMMPGMDGPDLCRLLRQSEMNKNTYVIMLTARSDPKEIVEGLKSGADDYVSKPPDMAILCARIDAGIRLVLLRHEVEVYAHEMERVAQERAVQLAHADRMSTLGVLSAGIAHEINNPTSFIAINLQTLETHWPSIARAVDGVADDRERAVARTLSAEMPQILAEMKDGVSRIREIVSGLKFYARLDSGARASTSLNECVEDALKLCRNRLKYHVDVDTCLAAERPVILADRKQIDQVIVNLLINAADALEEAHHAHGRITVTTRLLPEGVVMTVGDTGPGIPVAVLPKLFTPFYTTKKIGKGTGLGLAICRSIIEEHGGTITVANQPASGALFTITFPPSPPEGSVP